MPDLASAGRFLVSTAETTQQRLQRLRAEIREVDPGEAYKMQQDGAVVLDVREDDERVSGTPADAPGLSRGFLEMRASEMLPDRDRQILTLCGSGQRSLLAADTLLSLGYVNVASVAGGFARWRQLGLPVASGQGDPDQAERYMRQIQLPQVGSEGQARLASASVAVLGAGGLGAPALLYLAGAGVGRIRVIDDDRVERSNLHRQVIHADARVGMVKTESARMSLLALNPRIDIEIRCERLVDSNADNLLDDCDVIVDGTDNFATRYVVSAASMRLRIPMVYGALERFSGQASVFDPRDADSPCYRCLFAQAPTGTAAPNCSEAGVLGVLPGMVGLIQATETLKLILGLGQPLTGRLLNFDALSMRFHELKLPRDPRCPGCGAPTAAPEL